MGRRFGTGNVIDLARGRAKRAISHRPTITAGPDIQTTDEPSEQQVSVSHSAPSLA
jgi:hypothetical protein